MALRQRGMRGVASVRLMLALSLAVAALLAGSLPAAAFQVLSDTGQRGDYFFDETQTNPRVRCGYSAFVNDKSYLRWVRVKPPRVFAPDRTADKIDSMRVGWRVLVQKYSFKTSSWNTVAKSSVQKARAYENSPASLSAIKVYHSATNVTARYRAVVLINWYRADGSLLGRVRLAPDWTEIKQGTSIFPSGGPDCSGGIQIV